MDMVSNKTCDISKKQAQSLHIRRVMHQRHCAPKRMIGFKMHSQAFEFSDLHRILGFDEETRTLGRDVSERKLARARHSVACNELESPNEPVELLAGVASIVS